MAPRLVLVSAAVLGLIGCAAVGPEFHRPPPPSGDRYLPTPLPGETASAGAAGAAQRLVMGKPVESRWWTLFGSAKLDALEAEALLRSNDVAAARAALNQAHELLLAQRATLFPSVQLAASGARVKNAQSLASPLSSNAQSYSLYNAQFNVGYVLDVFGGQRRLVEASAAQEEAQRFQSEAVYLTLSANVANTAVQIAALNTQLTAVRANIAAYRRMLELTRAMQALGEASTADIAAADSALEQAEQSAPPLEKQIGQLQDLLAVFLGRSPAEANIPTLDLADFRLPIELPLSLPAELVGQRPDVRAAEANLHVASAQLGVAVAARLPSFNLTGSLGGTSSALDTLVSSKDSLWSVGGSLSQTVFDAGALRHRQEAAKAAFEQAQAQYRGTVMTALQNTADVLQAISRDAETLEHAARAAAAAENSARLARALFEHGQAGALPALNADATFHQAEVTLIQARAARFTDTVGLFQALGGGWVDDQTQRGRP